MDATLQTDHFLTLFFLILKSASEFEGGNERAEQRVAQAMSMSVEEVRGCIHEAKRRGLIAREKEGI
jgi:hypothetical protein